MLLSTRHWICPGGLSLLLGTSLSLAVQSQTSSGAIGTAADSGGLFEVWHDDGAWWLHDSVTAIVQTHDGYIWLATYHGLVRFDGVSFTVFDSSNVPEMPNGRITSLYESPDHVLWIGHETGHLTRLAAGRFQPAKLGTNWPGGVIETITSDEEGNIWLLNDSGLLYRLADGLTARTPGPATALRKATLARAADGRIWITGNGQVARLEQGRVVPVAFPDDSGSEMHERIFPSPDGGVWVLGNGQLRKWRAGGWREMLEALPGHPGAIGVVVETRYGLLAGTMREGLYLLRPGARSLHFTRADGLSHDWIRALCTDREGGCWIGTGTGFDGLRQRKVQMVAPSDGWQGCTVRSFIVEPDGQVWVGTEGAGLYHYDGQEWTAFNESRGLMTLFVWSVLKTQAHELFAGTWGGGLYRLNGTRFESPGELSQITAPVTALYEGRGGKLWIGTQSGLYCYAQGKLTEVAGKNQLVLPDVRAITETADGTIWFGMSGGGLGCLKSGVPRQFKKEDGPSSDVISCLYADPEGTLWIGTADNGLTRLKDGRFSTISTEQGLPDRRISQIADDGAGYLWLGSHQGILRVSKADLHRCADGRSDAVHCLSYGRAEGLTTQICPGGFQPGACRGADGRLWFPTTKGLAVLHPANVSSNAVPPPVVIESLLVDGVSAGSGQQTPLKVDAKSAPGVGAEFSNPLTEDRFKRALSAAGAIPRISPGHSRFEFHYTGLSFVAPDKVRFRRKLESLERDWVDVGTKRLVEYNHLPPGQYTFRVTAWNNDEVWSPDGASLAFTVLPYFWQTIGFKTASIASGAGLLAAGVFWAGRRRLRRELELAQRQRAVERERTRIARDMHDELGASLTRISLLSETIRSEISGQQQAAADADQIYTTAREVIRAMDEIVWAVNPAYDTLDSLVAYLGRYAERYLNAVGIRCRLDVPLDVPRRALGADVRHNVFLAYKEALHNVVKHAHASEVLVSVELSQGGFVLLIRDNGCGFVCNPAESPQPSSQDPARTLAGNGLANMRKRMDEIGGSCTWDSGPGKGTLLKLAVSIKPCAPS